MYRQFKLNVSDLKIGMYVAGLDRPWVETPFLFQGFNITSIDEIDALGKYCEFVFVDEEKSAIKNVRAHISSLIRPTTKITKIKTEGPRIALPKGVEFKRQMRQALSTHHNVKCYINKAMVDVQSGVAPDVKKARTLVNHLADNIVTNPTAMIWLTQLKKKDEYTANHSLNVCILALFFGRSIGMPMDQLKELGIGALLHDIGKLKVPLEVLNKPDRLTNDEYRIMRQHTVFGYDLLRDKKEISHDALQVIQNHHERLDGKGYPHKLVDHQINHYTKLVSIVDVYDAITSKRAYHDAMNPHDALNIIFKSDKGSFDQGLLEQFIKYLGVYPIGSVVELSSGQVGVVMSFNDKHHLTPLILLVLDENKLPYNQYRYLNLAHAVYKKNKEPLHISGIVKPEAYDLDVATIIKNESFHIAKE